MENAYWCSTREDENLHCFHQLPPTLTYMSSHATHHPKTITALHWSQRPLIFRCTFILWATKKETFLPIKPWHEHSFHIAILLKWVFGSKPDTDFIMHHPYSTWKCKKIVLRYIWIVFKFRICFKLPIWLRVFLSMFFDTIIPWTIKNVDAIHFVIVS